MATQDWKITFLCQNGPYGWSETYWCSRDGADAAQLLASQLATARDFCFARPAFIQAIRISTPGPVKQSLVYRWNTTYTTNFATQADVPWNAARYVLYSSTAGKQRSLYLRGIPDGAFDGGLNVDTPDLTLLDGAWRRTGGMDSLLKSTPFFVRYNPTSTQNYPILVWTGSTLPQVTTIETAVNPPWAEGDLITITGLKHFGRAPGSVRILTVVGPTEFTIQLSTPRAFSYSGGAKARKFVPADGAISSTQLQRITHRDTGRPFGLSRGARPKIAK